MQAIDFLIGWTAWLLAIIPAAAGTMIAYHSFRKTATSDDSVINECNLRIKNTIIGAVIGMTISGLITVIRSFYS